MIFGAESGLSSTLAAPPAAANRALIFGVDWLNVLAHELRTPLTDVLGIAELLFHYRRGDPAMADLWEAYVKARDRIDRLIADATLLVGDELTAHHTTPAVIEIGPVLCRAVRIAEERSGVRVVLPPLTGQGCWVASHETLLERALTELLFTAAHCVAPPERVDCRVEAGVATMACIVETNGRGLAPQDLETFFAVGGQREPLSPSGDWGLSPAVAQHILAALNGHATVTNRKPSGLRITVTLPRHTPEHSA